MDKKGIFLGQNTSAQISLDKRLDKKVYSVQNNLGQFGHINIIYISMLRYNAIHSITGLAPSSFVETKNS